MKKHLVDMTVSAESLTGALADITGLEGFVEPIAFTLDDDQRKRLQRLGLRNESFSRGVIELARQNPALVPAQLNLAAIERDVTARDTLLPVLFRINRIARFLEDTVIALGVDEYEGARALYKTMKITAAGSGVADDLEALGRRFARTAPASGEAEPTTPVTTTATVNTAS